MSAEGSRPRAGGVWVRQAHSGDAIWAHSRCGFTKAKPVAMAGYGWLLLEGSVEPWSVQFDPERQPRI